MQQFGFFRFFSYSLLNAFFFLKIKQSKFGTFSSRQL